MVGVIKMARHVQMIAIVCITRDLAIFRNTKTSALKEIIKGCVMTVIAFGRCWVRNRFFLLRANYDALLCHVTRGNLFAVST